MTGVDCQRLLQVRVADAHGNPVQGSGISASGGGTLTVTGANNTIAASGGAALNISGVAIGAQGLTFRSISANVVNITLNRLAVSGSAEQGINGVNVTGLTLSTGTIAGAGNGADEGSIVILGLFGTANVISDTTVTGSGLASHNLFIRNSSATVAAPGSPDHLLISGTSFVNPGSPAASGDYALARWSLGTFQLQGYVGAPNDGAAVQSFVSSRDVSGAEVNPAAGESVNFTGATCATP